MDNPPGIIVLYQLAVYVLQVVWIRVTGLLSSTERVIHEAFISPLLFPLLFSTTIWILQETRIELIKNDFNYYWPYSKRYNYSTRHARLWFKLSHIWGRPMESNYLFISVHLRFTISAVYQLYLSRRDNPLSEGIIIITSWILLLNVKTHYNCHEAWVDRMVVSISLQSPSILYSVKTTWANHLGLRDNRIYIQYVTGCVNDEYRAPLSTSHSWRIDHFMYSQ